MSSRTDRLVNSSITLQFRGKLSAIMAGHTSLRLHSAVDYKVVEALKSCHAEFVHIYCTAYSYLPFFIPTPLLSFSISTLFIPTLHDYRQKKTRISLPYFTILDSIGCFYKIRKAAT